MVAVFPVSKRFINIAKETVHGTPPTTGYVTVPCNKFDAEDKVTWLTDDSWRGSMAGEYGLIQGPMIADVEIGGPVYDDTIGFALANILGDYAVSGTTTYTHLFSLLNSGDGQPVTHTLVDRTGIPATGHARQYAYVCLSEVTITGNAEKLLEWSAKGTAVASTVPASDPTASVSTIAAQAAWNSTVSLAGSPVTDIGEWAITITRKIDPYWTAQGSQAPLVIGRGAATVSGKLTYAPSVDDTALTQMLANTQPELAIVATNGADSSTLTLHAQKAAYDTSKLNSGKSLFGYDVSFKAIANTVDVGASSGWSPIKATLVNKTPTY